MVGQKGYVPFFGNTQWCCETEFFGHFLSIQGQRMRADDMEDERL